jgi:hypothetical protein
MAFYFKLNYDSPEYRKQQAGLSELRLANFWKEFLGNSLSSFSQINSLVVMLIGIVSRDWGSLLMVSIDR